MDEAVTATILAGGAGQRLGGADKGLAVLGGRPLVAWCCDAIRSQVDAVLIAANRNRRCYAQFASVISDPVSGHRGPLAGIAAALAAVGTPWLVTLPVDSPRPPPDLVARLRAGRGTARTAVVDDGTRRQPLFALYHRDSATSAADALARNLPVWRWQDELGAVAVDFADRAAHFANLNTPQDFADFAVRHGQP